MTTRYTYIKHQGTWKQPKNVFIKQSGTWTPSKGIFYKRNGEWVRVWPSQKAIMTLSTDFVDVTTSLNITGTKQIVRITNSGDADLRITSITPTNPAKFTITIDNSGLGGTPSLGSPATIAPKASKYFEVSITGALLDGTDIGSIAITAFENVINEVTTKTVSVVGTVGVLVAGINLDRTSLSFNTSLTKTSNAIKVTVRNDGQENLRITSLGATTPTKFTINLITSAFGTPSVGTPVTIAPNSSKSFDVTITAGSSTGTDNGTITLGYLTDLKGTSGSSAISVDGSINALAAVLTTNPETLSFETVKTTEQTSIKTVSLKNTGNDVLTINTITASSPSRFTINVDQMSTASGGVGPTLPTTINANQSKSINVRLTAGASAGNDIGTITIGYTKDVLGGTASTVLSVSGTVVQPVLGTLTPAPASLSFNATTQTSSETQFLTLKNNGEVSITGLAFTYTNPAQFSITANFTTAGGFNGTLAPGASVQLGVGIGGVTVAGSGSGSINFTGTSGGSPVTLSYPITGFIKAAEPPAQPTCRIGNARFATVEETQLSFKIYNEGKAPLTITSITAPAWVTAITPQTATIAAGSNANFNATKAAGTLSTNYNDTTLTVNTGELGAVIGSISVNPQTGEPPSLTGTVTDYKEVKIPAGYTTCTFDARGGGGGGGGYNASAAQAGQAGSRVTGNFSVTAGDVIKFCPGRGGGAGQNQVSGGQSALAGLVSGPLSLVSEYAGGFGGTAGTVGLSGAGGGGGGASVILKNDAVVVVAGGGGGGGGAGLTAARASKNTLLAGTRGGTGADRHPLGVDGGGNGGGGGGAQGGAGGDYTSAGDAGGISGTSGSSSGGSITAGGGGSGGAAGTSQTVQNAGAGGAGSITYTISP